MIFKEIFTWWHNQTIGTRIWSFVNGYNVGDDNFGNVYMRNKSDSKRWVLYKGDVDSSKVPPEWNGWLRYTSNEIPTLQKKYTWEKDHIKNQTGTINAYYPSASILKNPHDKKRSEYEQWSPKD
jgi:NADH:ubiquinone oxidoreductase subunit|tara:strand:- start:213 stop:584 length:372 start_codon:yes stop_codon:yes gene_type:complete